jgi:hypothetical protein
VACSRYLHRRRVCYPVVRTLGLLHHLTDICWFSLPTISSTKPRDAHAHLCGLEARLQRQLCILCVFKRCLSHRELRLHGLHRLFRLLHRHLGHVDACRHFGFALLRTLQKYSRVVELVLRVLQLRLEVATGGLKAIDLSFKAFLRGAPPLGRVFDLLGEVGTLL